MKKISITLVFFLIFSNMLIFHIPMNEVYAANDITWTKVPQPSPVTENQLHGIIWGGEQFVAVGYNGTIIKQTRGQGLVWREGT